MRLPKAAVKRAALLLAAGTPRSDDQVLLIGHRESGRAERLASGEQVVIDSAEKHSVNRSSHGSLGALLLTGLRAATNKTHGLCAVRAPLDSITSSLFSRRFQMIFHLSRRYLLCGPMASLVYDSRARESRGRQS